MPQFVYDPTNPEPMYLNTATSGQPESNPNLPSPNQPNPVTGPAVSPGLSDAEKKRRAREKAKRQAEKRRAAQAAREEARRNRFNPFTAPFKSPAELRAEAARLAALGSPAEEALRAEQAREETGLAGLTTGLTTALTNIREAQTAGLAGLNSLYGQLGGAAQTAGQELAAAAGAPTSPAPSVTPTIAAFPGYGAAVRAYELVAPIIGTQLAGASRANLARALTQRAGQVSSDTAKYLRQLQQEEIDRAIAQETAAQNAARLSLTAEEAQRDYQIAQANLGLRQESNQIRWASLAQSAANAAARATQKAQGNKAKGIQAAKADILENITEWSSPSESSTGNYEYTIYYTDRDQSLKKVPRTIVAANSTEAARLGASDVPDWARGTVEVEQGNAVTETKPADFKLVSRQMRQILMNEGMTKKAANAWIAANVSPYFR
jgi:hypothetical protein